MANITGFSTTYYYESRGFQMSGQTGANLLLTAEIPFEPGNADYDFTAVSSNDSVAEPKNLIIEGIVYSAITVENGVVEVNILLYTGNTGSTVITLTDNISGLQTQRTIYNNPAGVSPNIYTSPSAITIPGNYSFDSQGYVSNMRKVTELQSTGCNILNALISETSFDSGWTEGAAPSVSNYSETNDMFLYGSEENTGAKRSALHLYTAYDTNYNTYLVQFILTQEASQPTDSTVYLNPTTGSASFQSTSSAVHVYYSGCSIVDSGTSAFTNFTYTVNGDSFITGISSVAQTSTDVSNNRARLNLNFTENTSMDPREAYINFTFYDTDGNAYYDTFHITQAAGSRIYIDPSAKTVNASDNSVSFFIYTSGCDLDTSNYSYSYSGDSVIVGIYITTAWENMYLAICSLTTNTSLTDREEYVDFVFHDTSGNSYTDTFKLTQLKNVYLSLSPYYTACTSAETWAEFTIEEVNCSFDYLSLIEDSSDFGPDYPITSSVTGNKLVLSVPLNTTQNYRIAHYHGNLYDTSGNPYSYSLMIQQSPGDGVKNISASISEANVGSGSSSTSGYVYAVSCTYDHFTYMTGGSMQITVTSGANNVIYVNTPANNTSNSRVGYAYITFYDTDGNEYHQTITIRQAAGTGPGPGPQPEPTWNVLTSLTISDNEQHRFFVEAEAGKSYKANDVIYKTVSACEARYALYYINSYGGVDVMVFKGRSNKKTDNITRFNYTRSFRNNTLEFENVNYMNEMKAAWELQTGWLNDRQSKKMHELVESTCVYLYDAQEQVYIPVVMTDKTLEYKTYKNQNNRFYNYTVKVEESQSKERR